MTPRTVALMCVAAALIGAAPAAAQDGLSGKRAQAAAIQARIEAQGARMSMATEDYNQARSRRQSFDAKLAAAEAEVAAAQERWLELRRKLGGRIKVLYMYPGAQLEVWLGLRDSGPSPRARALSERVISSDGELIHKTAAARAEMEEVAVEVGALRDEARKAEEGLAAKRATVEKELRAQQALLRNVNGEIKALIDAERRRQLEEAARRAAAEAAARAAAENGDQPAAGGPPPAPSSDPLEDPPADPPTRASAAKAVETARAQIGKPYEWGASGPGSYDCSGLTMYAWNSAGVSLPHSSRDQYSATRRVSRDSLEPGDLLFYGSPIHHVAIYEGGGIQIEAPQTGEQVRRAPTDRSDYVGAGRP